MPSQFIDNTEHIDFIEFVNQRFDANLRQFRVYSMFTQLVLHDLGGNMALFRLRWLDGDLNRHGLGGRNYGF